jgi:hypothetical protein
LKEFPPDLEIYTSTWSQAYVQRRHLIVVSYIEPIRCLEAGVARPFNRLPLRPARYESRQAGNARL